MAGAAPAGREERSAIYRRIAARPKADLPRPGGVRRRISLAPARRRPHDAPTRQPGDGRCSSASSTSSRSASARRRATPWGRCSPPRASSTLLRAGHRPHSRRGPPRPARLPAARQPRLHRQGPRHRPRGDPRPRRLHPRGLRRRPRRGRARRDRCRTAHRRPRPRPARLRPATPTSSSTTAPPSPATPTAWCCWPGTPRGNLHAQETYYSVGGGFVLTARELGRPPADAAGPPVPYPFATAAEMLAMARASGLGIAAMKRANELTRRGAADTRRRPRPALGGDVGLHRPRPRRPAGRAARRPAGAPPRRRDPRRPARRARPQPRPRRTRSTTGSRSTPSP